MAAPDRKPDGNDRNIVSPQRRHQALVPLSHDHHQGLVAAQRLKRGEPAYRSSSEPCGSILELWEKDLAFHFHQEETLLFVHAGGESILPVLVRRALDEHDAFREMVEACRAGRCDSALVRRFGALLESHIRFEERELFPAFQQWLAAPDIEAIGTEIRGEREGRDALACDSGGA